MNDDIKLYRVGGCVRDKILGVKSKDIDFSVEAPSFDAMRDEIVRRGGEIFLEKPEYLTIRARVPELGAADFVLCRKDGAYYDGRRPENVELGTLMDDLCRRDFTMNAIAEDEDGRLIDPFSGQLDMIMKVINCVGNTRERFEEDYLRMLRALRFSITKSMGLSLEIRLCLQSDMADKIADVAEERVREEMLKCFRADTPRTLLLLEEFPRVRAAVFSGKLWLKPTMEH
jgi:tRNA nucleotidyltransferase (CCA-adding enzyme)